MTMVSELTLTAQPTRDLAEQADMCMTQPLADYYRWPQELGRSALGIEQSGSGSKAAASRLQRIDDLRCERYATRREGRFRSAVWGAAKETYYRLRPLMHTSMRRQLQRLYFMGWKNITFPQWPLDCTVDSLFEEFLTASLREGSFDRIPFIWFWPNGAQSCAIMTHDVETLAGRDFCPALMDLDDSFNIKSSFQVVPEERYAVSPEFLAMIRDRGFEINLQDLNHDGRLFDSHEQFLRRAQKINDYARRYQTRGFRSAVLYREAGWYDALEFSYDMSVPNVGHLEVQRGGCCTVMPFFIGNLVELPVTTTQDYSLFHIIGDYSISLWKKQISLIHQKHGLANFIVHPDYIGEKRARDVYKALLQHLAELKTTAELWIPLPGAVDRWWRSRNQMKLVWQNNAWQIEGPDSERARVAYATLDEGRLIYTVN